MLLIGIPYAILEGLEYHHTLIYCIAKAGVQFILCLTLLQSATGMMRFSHGLNGVCWFLSTLFCIYLVSPFVMRFLKQKVKNVKSAFVGIIICMCSSFILAVVFGIIEQNTFFDDLCYGTPYRRIFYVMMGMLLAQIYVFEKESGMIAKRTWISSGKFEYTFILLSMIWFFVQRSATPILGNFVYFINMGIVACDVYALAMGKGKISHFFESETMVCLGNISMYIFLTHYLIRMYVDYFVRTIGLESLAIGIMEVFFILISSMLISVWIHTYRTNKVTIKE